MKSFRKEKALNLTGRAAKQVRKIKQDENLDDELYLRVAVERRLFRVKL
ncbi:hypothetical protein [Rhodohalobacter sp.]|nr:hypothetical protein [Rhodohalobacter sp.]MDZ7758288.1 hypothetical protein [Rhodohalobacter sp.]